MQFVRLDARPKPFDLDAQEREVLETAHEMTRFHRGAGQRRAVQISRFLHDPATVRAAASLPVPGPSDLVIPLPEVAPRGMTLANCLAGRHSVQRDQLGGVLPLDQLAALLNMAARSQRSKPSKSAPDAIYRFRPYPSGGALYPCDIHVVPGAVCGLDRPCRYDAREHSLVDYGVPAGDFRSVETALYPASPPAAFVISAVLDRTIAKYGPRGYRFALLEAGHIGQNLILAATALGLPSLVYSSYHDAELERWLGFDGINEVALSVILVGGGLAGGEDNNGTKNHSGEQR